MQTGEKMYQGKHWAALFNKYTPGLEGECMGIAIAKGCIPW